MVQKRLCKMLNLGSFTFGGFLMDPALLLVAAGCHVIFYIWNRDLNIGRPMKMYASQSLHSCQLEFGNFLWGRNYTGNWQ